MINEILKYGGMKIGLQDAVSAVHVTVSADVQNMITTAGIRTRSRAFFDECAFVIG